jgi:hypothetical protein
MSQAHQAKFAYPRAVRHHAEMAEPHIVTTLRSKRDELERIIGSYEKATDAARYDLSHVNATLQLFERGADPKAYPSKMSIIRLFKRGEVFAICKAALAQAPNGMDTRELALAVIRSKALDECDTVLRKAVAYSIINVMRQQHQRGAVADGGRSRGVRVWRLSQR